jgi:hypothetical protein
MAEGMPEVRVKTYLKFLEAVKIPGIGVRVWKQNQDPDGINGAETWTNTHFDKHEHSHARPFLLNRLTNNEGDKAISSPEDEEKTNFFHRAYLRGDKKIPPVVIMKHPKGVQPGGRTHLVVDGHHRVQGAARAGMSHIPAIEMHPSQVEHDYHDTGGDG